MNTRLTVRISARDSTPDKSETYAQLEKEIDLPFAPIAGMDLVLPCIEDGHPNAALFDEAMKSEVLVTGILRVDSVRFNLRTSEFEIETFDGYESADEVGDAVRQYVFGYGFTEDDTFSAFAQSDS